MTDDSKKNDGNAPPADDEFKVEIPGDLFEEAVEAVERRVAEAKPDLGARGGAPSSAERVIETPQDVDSQGIEMAADGAVESEPTTPDGAIDLENMSVEDMMAGGYLPDKVVTAFNEERARVMESRVAASDAQKKSAAVLEESDAFRRRITREKNDSVKFASENVLKEILPVVDNLERALQHTDTSPGTVPGAPAVAGSIREGVEITLRQFHHILTKLGVTRVPVEKGTPFDPRVHEAVSQVEAAGLPPNSVAAVFANGYLLHDRLLRPAMVSVAKGSPGMAAVEPPETADEKLERIRRTGSAARSARQKKRDERKSSSTAADDADAGVLSSDITVDMPMPADVIGEITDGLAADDDSMAVTLKNPEPADAALETTDPGVVPASMGLTNEDTVDEFAASDTEKTPPPAETPEEKLERIRRTGAAAREARAKKREERNAREAAGPTLSQEAEDLAVEAAVATTPPRIETEEEKLARIRKAGSAARDARAKKKAERESREMGTNASAPSTGDKPGLPAPDFQDDDLENWESSVDSIRTDKSSTGQGRRG